MEQNENEITAFLISLENKGSSSYYESAFLLLCLQFLTRITLKMTGNFLKYFFFVEKKISK